MLLNHKVNSQRRGISSGCQPSSNHRRHTHTHTQKTINDLRLHYAELHASVPSNNLAERETVISRDVNGADAPLDRRHYSLSESLIRFRGPLSGQRGPIKKALRDKPERWHAPCMYRSAGLFQTATQISSAAKQMAEAHHLFRISISRAPWTLAPPRTSCVAVGDLVWRGSQLTEAVKFGFVSNFSIVKGIISCL